jgi:hypothetical protein
MLSICVSMCSLSLSLSLLFVNADRRCSGVDLHSHTHSLSLSVSPLPCLSLSHLKGAATLPSGAIEIQISLYSVLIISKVALIRKKYQGNLPQYCFITLAQDKLECLAQSKAFIQWLFLLMQESNKLSGCTFFVEKFKLFTNNTL